MEKKGDKKTSIRITDEGAISGLIQFVNTLILIAGLLGNQKLTTVEELVDELKLQIRKMLSWLERMPDGSTYGDLSKRQISIIRRDAQQVLDWNIIPSEEDYKKREVLLREWESSQEEIEDLEPLRLLPDTSFLLAYLLPHEAHHEFVNVVVNYLKTQRKYLHFHLSNVVLLELVSKLKQQHSFTRARATFEDLLAEMGEENILVNNDPLNLFEIFERYQQFSRKALSSELRGNDFFIVTDGILSDAIIVTCDRGMYEAANKTYKKIFLITEDASSYTSFIKEFEKIKAEKV